MNIAAQGTFFCPKTSINCRGKLLDLSTPIVMGIVNLTNDSFYHKSRFSGEKLILERVENIITEGGSIIDLGAQSSRPGAENVNSELEGQKLTQAIQVIRNEFPAVIISVDTYRASVAKRAIDAGGDIVNDISGGTLDENMFPTIAELGAPYVLMHIQGNPGTMQNNPYYENVTSEVFRYFFKKVLELRMAGVKDIIIDLGFGFGKTVEHNYQLLNDLDKFRLFELPILTGISRKSMINKVLNINPKDALNGTSILNTIALRKGTNILRVHDVKEAAEAIKLSSQLKQLPKNVSL